MYTIKVKTKFKDLTTKDERVRYSGEILKLNDVNRVRALLGNNPNKIQFAELMRIDTNYPKYFTDRKIIIYHNYLYKIGGIETWVYNFVKEFNEYDITVVCKDIDKSQMEHIGQYANVEIDRGQSFECEVLVLGNYDAAHVLSRTKADKVYQIIHADWQGIIQQPIWHNFVWKKDNRIDEIITVSQTAKEGLLETMGYDSEVIYNPLDQDFKEEDGLTFITLSRMTSEKGGNRILKMARKMKEEGRKFIWLLCCTLEQCSPELIKAIKDIPEFVIIEPSIHNKTLIKNCDYLVQLSDTESFCYSAYEALQRQVPVILTDFPEAFNIVDDGENGYIVKRDLSDLDLDKIFNHIPKAQYYIDRCNTDKWEQMLKGEL